MARRKAIKKGQGIPKTVPPEETKSEPMGRGQIWSIDVLLAVVIFVSIMIIFYVTITSNDRPGIKDLQAEANFLKGEFENNDDYAFMKQDEVDNTKFDQFVDLTAVDYETVKQGLGIRGDFCIYLEDENGNLVLLKENRTGIGSGDVNITGTPCGQKKW